MAGDYRKKEKIFSIITTVSEVLSLSSEPQQLLDMVLDTLLEVLKIDCCWVQLFNLESRELWLAAYRGFTPNMKREIVSMDLGHNLGNQVVALGHKIVIPNLSRDSQYGLSSFSKAGLCSLVAAPLRTYHIQGVMGIASRAKKRFPTEVTELLMVIASLVGTALDKADLYQRALAREKQLSTGTRLSVTSSPSKGDIYRNLVTEFKEAGEEWGTAMVKQGKAVKQIAEQTPPSQADSFSLQTRRHGVPGKVRVTDKITVFVIDDQHLFRQGLRLFLSQTGDIELIGESDYLEDTAAIVEELAPNLVLIGINLPSLRGLGLAQQISQRLPGISVIILTLFEDDNQILEALKAGVAGYICKSITPEGLASVIRRVFKGEHIIDELLVRPEVAQRVLTQLQGMEKEDLTKPLWPLEIEMLAYFANGYSCKQVAHAMGVSMQKIANSMASVVSKLVANMPIH